jgi:hypothetical protein
MAGDGINDVCQFLLSFSTLVSHGNRDGCKGLKARTERQDLHKLKPKKLSHAVSKTQSNLYFLPFTMSLEYQFGSRSFISLLLCFRQIDRGGAGKMRF